jgi:hypothetical protein
MPPASTTPVDCHYVLDAAGNIVTVSTEWDALATDYQAPGAASEHVLGQPWQRFVSGAVTTHIYERLFARVRTTGEPLRFEIRCDQPAERRLLELAIAPANDRGFLVTTRLIEASARPPVALFELTPREAERLLVLCSWCSRFQVGPSQWHEPELAMKALGLFAGDALPKLSHGMCGNCFQRVNRLVGEA